MTGPRRAALVVALGLLALVVWNSGWLSSLPIVGPSGPVDYVVIVNESGDRSAEHAAVILGKTALELRDKDKWRMWDKDQIPKSLQESIKALIAGHDLPVVMLYTNKGLVAGPDPCPTSDEKLREYVEKYGGF